ncbi:MAG: pilus assembly protein PilM [Acidobacteriia bacterium]|nr:pilus assembly protein PilM [Terriglobia bacterium]
MIYLKTSVGIEIRQQDLLISCLRSNFAGGVFTNYMRVSGYRQRDPEQVRDEIHGFFKREKVNRDNIVLGLPRQDVILRYLDLPKEVEDNLKQVMLFQVQSFEPTDEEKLYYDFVPIRNGQPDKRLHVLVMMIRKSILDAHLETMRQLGICPAAVTAGSVALANMFLGTHNDGRDKTFIMADLKPGGIELAVLRGGALIYGREAARPGGVPLKQFLLSEMEVAVGKVRLDPEESIDGIIMAGEESESALQELWEDVPGCELMGDRLRFEMSPENKAFLQEAVTSLGLAYVGITRRLPMKLNLLPAERRVHQKRWAYVPTIILGLCIAAALAGLGFHQMVQQQTLIRNLDQEIKKLEAPANRVRELRSQSQALGKRIASLEEVLQRRDQNLDILRELTNLLPSDTYLRQFRNQDCTITLNGESPPSASSDLISKIEKSPLLKDVITINATFKNIQTGKDIFSFQAKCEK